MRRLLGAVLAAAAVVIPAGEPSRAQQPATTHWWWTLTEEQARSYFNEGSTAHRQGKDLLALPFESRPRRVISARDARGCETLLDSVTLEAPPFVLRSYGWIMEEDVRKSKDPDAKEKWLERWWENIISPEYRELSIKFSIRATGRNIWALQGLRFAMKTSAGTLVDDPNPAGYDRGCPLLSIVGQGADSCTSKTVFSAAYGPKFPLKDTRGVPYVTSDTQWVALIVDLYGVAPRSYVKFWIDGSGKTEAGGY